VNLPAKPLNSSGYYTGFSLSYFQDKHVKRRIPQRSAKPLMRARSPVMSTAVSNVVNNLFSMFSSVASFIFLNSVERPGKNRQE